MASGGFYGVGETVSQAFYEETQQLWKRQDVWHILPDRDSKVWNCTFCGLWEGKGGGKRALCVCIFMGDRGLVIVRKCGLPFHGEVQTDRRMAGYNSAVVLACK